MLLNFVSEQPTIKQVANIDTNAIPDDDEKCVIVLWDPNIIPPEVSSEDRDYDDQAESNSDDGDVNGDANELPAQAKQGAKGIKAPPPPAQQCTLPADDAPARPPAQRSKGKGKELSTPAHDEDTDDAHQDPQDSDANNPLAPGQLLVEAICKAIALVSTKDWQEEQYDSYLECHDQTENPLLWKEIRENFDECWTNEGKSPKAIGQHIMAVRNAFASSLVKDLVDEKQADLTKLVDYMATVVKYKLLDDTASLPSFPQIVNLKFNPELSCEKGEGSRDHNCHVALLMMLDKFGELW
ncbi:hypothetical protein AZE42_13228 [Rhizopogon vesiculosus]|uniref:Uncharacterized protein n=1 Tax=Rhizopogon vesiculosus TaxID=180088 RepID=A0A1J8PZ97_9AGAM|nr:hypothetical protein AZE42_13228 [Rhizopogon vesiculosus]